MHQKYTLHDAIDRHFQDIKTHNGLKHEANQNGSGSESSRYCEMQAVLVREGFSHILSDNVCGKYKCNPFNLKKRNYRIKNFMKCYFFISAGYFVCLFIK